MDLNEIFKEQISRTKPLKADDKLELTRTYYDGSQRNVGDVVLFFAVEREPELEDQIGKDDSDNWFDVDEDLLAGIPVEEDVIVEYVSCCKGLFDKMNDELEFVGIKDRMPTFKFK